MKSGVTEFSPCVQLVLQAAGEVLSYARQYRRDRHWALPPVDARPALPEGMVYSDDEKAVRDFFAVEGIVLPEGWDDPPSQSARRFRARLAADAHGGLAYEMRVYDPCDFQHEPWTRLYRALDAPQQARRRPCQLLPSTRPFLLVTFTTQADLEALRRASTASQPPAPHVPRTLTIALGLGGRSAREQRRWRQRRGDGTQWLMGFRQWARRGPTQRSEERQALLEILKADPSQEEVYARAVWVHQQIPQYGRGDRDEWPFLYVNKSTTPDDITAQLLAYLLQEEMVQWEEIAPWATYYDQLALDEGTRYQRMRELALPAEANALRPTPPPPTEPGAYSRSRAAKELGITDRQLRYRIEQQEIPGIGRHGRRVVMLPEALEHLRPQVDDQAHRHQAKRRRAAFTAKAQHVYKRSPDAIRQMIKRGPKTPEGTPDWDALEAQLQCKAAQQRHGKAEAAVASHDDLIAACQGQLAKVELGSEEWAVLQDKLRELQQGASP